jgi:hypothetical protein
MRPYLLAIITTALLIVQGCSGNAPPPSPRPSLATSTDLWVALAPTYVTDATGATRQCTSVLVSSDGSTYQEIRNPQTCDRCLIDDPNWPLQLDPQLWSIGGKFWASYTVHTQSAPGIGQSGHPQFTGVKWGMSWSNDLVTWHWGAIDMTGLVTELGFDPKSPDTVIGSPGFIFAPNCLTGDPAQDFKCVTTTVFTGPNFDNGIYSLKLYAAHPVNGNFDTGSYPAASWRPMEFPPNDRGHGPTDPFPLFINGKWFVMTAPDGYWDSGTDLVNGPRTWKGYLKTTDGSHLPQDTCSGGTAISPSDTSGHWTYTCTDVLNPLVIDQYTASNNDVFSGWVFQGQAPGISNSGHNGFFVTRRQEKDLTRTLNNLAANTTCKP